ncbi:hypothetical protein EPUS_06095 [Endocarpon pusillum Z07020]|uniref:Large ribosomal subunit protein mL43 n=1 Tax=Endocarpon pusillum (strain Z07020 / HMAS-L-300199) TaxID=1263415 RepID=U1HSX3_ENDPU|nr:uncharacterized protein EPUS_06095 [Endocarpon pusillum Z07020]ERF72339.1 hypothetical protein EPUS_06095 [Endocarpon pusillum Z07020]
MPLQGIRTVATNQNGVGAFILQCKRLDLHYCDCSFLTSELLPRLSRTHPQVSFHISPRPNKHPVLRAHYINGREKAVCVRNLEKEQIMQKCELLVQSQGGKNRKIRGRNVLSENESVRGIWSPFHGGIKDV